jgi:hypothetical protein
MHVTQNAQRFWDKNMQKTKTKSAPHEFLQTRRASMRRLSRKIFRAAQWLQLHEIERLGLSEGRMPGIGQLTNRPPTV